MSQSGLQLLLHAGEVEYIVKTIRKSRNKQFVGGCLFGLWRNSLVQPVIQFVTGPGKNFDDRSIEKMFASRRGDFVNSCVSIMGDKHCLLHLGFWFHGSEEQLERAQNKFFESGSKFAVLLRVDLTKEEGIERLEGTYQLRKENLLESSQLFKEDVLPGHSSFRKFKVLINEIKGKGDLVSPDMANEVARDTVNLIEDLPSRVQVEEAVTSDEQWYSTDEGMKNLQLLFKYFEDVGIKPEMSRDTVTQDIQFGLSGGYILDFPANFPHKMPTFHAPNGGKYQIKRKSGEDACRKVVDAVVDFLRNAQQSSQHQYR